MGTVKLKSKCDCCVVWHSGKTDSIAECKIGSMSLFPICELQVYDDGKCSATLSVYPSIERLFPIHKVA